MPRTPNGGEDRREQIMRAAMRVFAEKGFTRATNRDIAQAAGITTGLIYYYFKSKEALLQALLEERSPAQIMAQIQPEMFKQPPEIFLPLVLRRVIDVLEDEQFIDLLRVILPEMVHETIQASPLVLGLLQRVSDFMQRYLAAQVGKGTLRADLRVEMAGQVLVSSMVGLMMRRHLMHDPRLLALTREELVQAVLDTLLPGMLPR